MKNKWLGLLTGLCLTFAVQAQQPYYFGYQIDSILAVDTTPYRYQTACWNYAFKGDYRSAVTGRDKQYPNAKPSMPNHVDESLRASLKVLPAHEVILKEAANSRLLIVNEAHHVSQHRAWLGTLLPELKKLGYTHIGMEALGRDDTLLNQREYAIQKSGFYTSDPAFGNLIRDARALGFTLFPYEQVWSDSLQKIMGREKSQATNIMKVMEANPHTRFIIYCGYDHIAEDTLRTFMGLPMAGQLKQLSGINPFTVDQTILTEHGIVGNSFRKLIHESQPVVLVDSAGHYFNRVSAPKRVDVSLYHPDSREIGGRPHWLLANGRKFKNIQKKITVPYPCLIKVYLQTDDYSEAVPVDVVEMTSAAESKDILLYHGKKHRVLIKSKNGQEQELIIK